MTCDPVGLAAILAERCGPEHVVAGQDDGMDLHVWPGAIPPICVVSPGSAEEVADVIRLASGVAILPVGAGLSYTGGAVCNVPHITLDTSRLDRIEIHADDLYAVVGAGCTWEALSRALKPLRLRVPLAAPISGSVSTMGGALSQNLPGSMDAVLGLQVVLGDGTLLTTGSAALAGRAPFYRNAGPDLTGLFLGDCGAFGVKVQAVLRLAPERKVACGSFAFADPVALVRAIAAVQRADPDASCMALDPGRAASAMRGIGLSEAIRIGLSLIRRGRISVGGFGGHWALHVTAESAAFRRLAIRKGGRPIAATVPAALQDHPFSIRGALGPAAERWVPVHGLLPLSAAPAAMQALLDTAAAHEAERCETGITLGWLISARAAHVLFEPMFLWPDALGTTHLKHLPSRVTTRAAERPAAPHIRAVVDRMRAEMRDTLDAHGAVHLQIGRYYDQPLDPAARKVREGLKRMLDPDRRINPGSAGL
jgi:D-lactate dehydrogenase (cytochrome)